MSTPQTGFEKLTQLEPLNLQVDINLQDQLKQFRERLQQTSVEYGLLLYHHNYHSLFDWRYVKFLETNVLMKIPTNEHFTFKQIIILNYLRYYVKHHLIEIYGNMNLSETEQTNFKYLLDKFKIKHDNKIAFNLYIQELNRLETYDFKTIQDISAFVDLSASFRSIVLGIDYKYHYLKSHYRNRKINAFLHVICQRLQYDLVAEIETYYTKGWIERIKSGIKTIFQKKTAPQQLIDISRDSIALEIKMIQEKEAYHDMLTTLVIQFIMDHHFTKNTPAIIASIRKLLTAIDNLLDIRMKFYPKYELYIKQKKDTKNLLRPIPNDNEIDSELQKMLDKIQEIVVYIFAFAKNETKEQIEGIKDQTDLQKKVNSIIDELNTSNNYPLKDEIKYVLQEYSSMLSKIINSRDDINTLRRKQKLEQCIYDLTENILQFKTNLITIKQKDILEWIGNYQLTPSNTPDEKSEKDEIPLNTINKKMTDIKTLQNQINNNRIPRLYDSLKRLYNPDSENKKEEQDPNRSLLLKLFYCIQSNKDEFADQIIDGLFLSTFYKKEIMDREWTQNEIEKQELLRYVKTILKYEYLIGVIFTKFIHYSSEILSKKLI